MKCSKCGKDIFAIGDRCGYGEMIRIKATGMCTRCANKAQAKPRDPMLTDSIRPRQVQTIGELWESLAVYAQGRHEDNAKYDGAYIMKTRKAQMAALHSLVNAIDEFHKRWEICPSAFDNKA